MLVLRKTIIAITGLFICVFLIVHLAANLLLLLPPHLAQDAYNSYSAALRHNFFIKIVAYVNYACILLHVIYAILISVRNRQSRKVQYSSYQKTATASWTSQNMALLGSILFAFIIIHMANFWYPIKIQGHDSDIYGLVISHFKNPLYTIVYTVAMLPLALHLAHGVHSAFKSLGLYHKKYLRWVATASTIYAAIIGVGFAVIPLVVFLR